MTSRSQGADARAWPPARPRPGRGGFTLVEVLVACALLSLAIVPILRAFAASRHAADAIVEGAAAGVSAASAAAERAFLEAGRDGGRQAAAPPTPAWTSSTRR